MQQGQERGKRKQETGHLTVGDRRRQWCTRPIRNAGSHAIGRLQQQIREWYVSVLGQSQDNFIILHTFWRKHNLVLLPMQHRITGLNVISSLLWQSKFYNRMPTGGTWSEKEQQTKLRKGIRSLPQPVGSSSEFGYICTCAMTVLTPSCVPINFDNMGTVAVCHQPPLPPNKYFRMYTCVRSYKVA